MYILCFDLEDTIENQEFHFLTKICENEISVEMKNRLLKRSLRLFSLIEIFRRK